MDPIEKPLTEGEPCGPLAPDHIPVYIPEPVLESITKHAGSRVDAMVGGVLLGEWCIWQGSPYIVIRDHIIADQAQNSEVTLTFTQETWRNISAEIDRRYGRDRQLLIAGWYFTSPGKGLDPGRVSLETHARVFTAPWQLLMVLDAVKGELALFQWKRGELASCGFYLVLKK